MQKQVPLRYRLLLILLSPLILAHLFHFAIRRGGGKRYLRQRLSLTEARLRPGAAWLHAASVGEFHAALPLLELCMQQQPGIHWLITTNTVTGAKAVEQKLAGKVEHYYLPVDYRFTVTRFLKQHRPRFALIMETELWPNLYYGCKQQNVPIAIVNARLSKRTLNMPRWLGPVARFCLTQTSAILARNKRDKLGYIRLGANPNKVKVVGNIKYAAQAQAAIKHSNVQFDRPYVLAASTHDNEEQQLVELWKTLNLESHLLVVAPRYPDRRQTILDIIIKTGLTVAVHSRKEPVNKETDIYLVDTLGELADFMSNAELVFMGGSLVPRGGQNVLEPAKLGKATITGPHSFTFAEDIKALEKADAIVTVNSANELKSAISHLLQNPDRRKELGDNAYKFMHARADVAQRYVEELTKLGWLKNSK